MGPAPRPRRYCPRESPPFRLFSRARVASFLVGHASLELSGVGVVPAVPLLREPVGDRFGARHVERQGLPRPPIGLVVHGFERSRVEETIKETTRAVDELHEKMLPVSAHIYSRRTTNQEVTRLRRSGLGTVEVIDKRVGFVVFWPSVTRSAVRQRDGGYFDFVIVAREVLRMEFH